MPIGTTFSSDLFERKLEKIVGQSKDPTERSKKITEAYLSEMISPTIADPQRFDYCVCDAKDDGGLDAWGVDVEKKEVYLIQCKWFENDSNLLTYNDSRELYEFVIERLLPDNRHGLNTYVKDFLARYRSHYSNYKVHLRYLTNGKFESSATKDYDSLDKKFTFKVIDKYVMGTQWQMALEMEEPVENHLIVAIKKDSYFTTSFPVPAVEDIPQQDLKIIQCSLSAKDLASAYDAFQSKLLIRNLRYGGLPGKINYAIKQTAESDLRFAFYVFHNGISIICDTLDLLRTDGSSLTSDRLVQDYPYISEEEAERITEEISTDSSKDYVLMRNFQIVNGAQSTETLAEVKRDKARDIFIPCKITQTNSSHLAGMISVYNNSQNSIKPTDLAANSGEQVFLQNYAAFEIDPPIFYMRKRRQKWTDIFRVSTPTPPNERRIDYPGTYQAFMSFMGNPIDAYSRPGNFINPDRTLYIKINEYSRKDLIILSGLLAQYEKTSHTEKDPEFTNHWRLFAVATFGHVYRTHFNHSQQQSIEDALFSKKGNMVWKKISRNMQRVFEDVIQKNFGKLQGRQFESLFRGEFPEFDLSKIKSVKPKDIYSLVDPRLRKTSLSEMKNEHDVLNPVSLQYYHILFAVFARLFDFSAPESFDRSVLMACK